MSEVKSRPSGPRGRGSGRGGRGGYSSRGGRSTNRPMNGDTPDITEPPPIEDEGEIGELKKKYASKLSMIKEMFPDWTDEDLAFALQETDGDLEATIEQISDGNTSAHLECCIYDLLIFCLGNISQWGEVKKKTKDRSQSKAKDAIITTAEAVAPSTRGGRGRGAHEGSRGGRGRASDRGRGATRGGRAGSNINGPRRQEKVIAETTVDIGGWDEAPKTDGVIGDWDQPVDTGSTPLESSWENVTSAEATPAPEPPKPSLKPDGTRSWASIFNKPAPAPAPAPKKAPVPPATSEEPASEIQEAEQPASVAEDMPGLPPPAPTEDEGTESVSTPPTSAAIPSEPALDITPSKDQLTETNLEQLPDVSEPAPVATAASTAASTVDQRVGADSSTPLHASQQPPDSRPPLGGYATSAYKATGMAGRSTSYQRKVTEQQEAVVMPGKHAVDRAAVQFGSMGLNGAPEDLDVDSDREEAETRAQPPQHSPIAPRASLPPPSQAQGLSGQAPVGEALPTPRQAPGLPPPNQQTSAQSLAEQPSQQSTQSSYPYNQYGGRYGIQDSQHETQAPAQKAYEPFGQQLQQSQHPYGAYPSTSQPQAPTHQAQVQSQHSQSQIGGQSSAPSEPSSYYTSDSQRNAYQNYYGSYGQQPHQSQQDSGTSQQRVGSAFGTSAPDQASQYATSYAQQHPQSRYGQTPEAQNSGNSTPNPSMPSQQQHQPQQGQQMHQHGQGQGGHQGAYPYNHPYYASPFYAQFVNQHVNNHPYGRDRPMFDDVRRYDEQYLSHNAQYGYGGQGGYGGGPFGGAGGKQNMYAQPHQGYGAPQSNYDQHTSSPANVGGFGQQSAPSRDGPGSGGLGGYGRTGSTQPSEGQQPYGGGSSYNGIPDVFGRGQSGYPGQTQNHGSQQASQQSGNEDSLRGYGDSKGPSGPSPALGQPGGRPGSAANTIQSQSGLPPSQGHNQGQQGYGGYPGHHQQSSQYAASPGLGGHQQSAGQGHQTSNYGAYGAGFGGNYYGNNNRGGWGATYGH